MYVPSATVRTQGSVAFTTRTSARTFASVKNVLLPLLMEDGVRAHRSSVHRPTRSPLRLGATTPSLRPFRWPDRYVSSLVTGKFSTGAMGAEIWRSPALIAKSPRFVPAVHKQSSAASSLSSSGPRSALFEPAGVVVISARAALASSLSCSGARRRALNGACVVVIVVAISVAGVELEQ